MVLTLKFAVRKVLMLFSLGLKCMGANVEFLPRRSVQERQGRISLLFARSDRC